MEDIYTVQEKAKIVEQVQDARVNIIEAKQKIVNERQKNAVQV